METRCPPASLFPTKSSSWPVKLRPLFGITRASAHAMQSASSREGTPPASVFIIRAAALVSVILVFVGVKPTRSAPQAGKLLVSSQAHPQAVPKPRFSVRVTNVSAELAVCYVLVRLPPPNGNRPHPISRLFLWKGGRVLWRSRRLRSFAWVAYLQRTHRIVSATEADVHVRSLRRGRSPLRFRPPWAFSYFPNLEVNRSGSLAATFLVVTPRPSPNISSV